MSHRRYRLTLVPELPEGFIPAREARPGVTATAFSKWLFAHQLTRKAQAVLVRQRLPQGGGPYLAVSLDIAERYATRRGAPRVDRPPPGWLNMKRASRIMPVSSVERARQSGAIQAVVYRGSFYYDPAELRRYRLELQSRRAPPGWLCLAELRARRPGLPLSTRQWLRYLTPRGGNGELTGHIRLFFHPTRHRLMLYASPTALGALERRMKR